MKKQPLVERQHFVPKTYLKHFGRQEGRDSFVHRLPKDSIDPDDIDETNTKNIGLSKNIYTLHGETTEQKMAIEYFYRDHLEDHYNRMYDLLINPNKIEITAEERNLIISTVVTMYYRTTSWVTMHKRFMKRVFERVFEMSQANGKDEFKFEDETFSIKGREVKEFTQEWLRKSQPGMALTQLETAFKLIPLRKRRDTIMVADLNSVDHEFITSDNPVIASNNKVQRLIPFDPDNMLRLPIDSKHILILIPDPSGPVLDGIFRNPLNGIQAGVERLTSNYQEMKFSENFIIGSKSGLEKYLATKELSEKKRTDDELNDEKVIKSELKKLGIE